MKNKFLTYLALSFIFTMHLSSLTTVWQGGISNDMLNPNNWSAGIPGSTDTGQFDATAVSLTPSIDGGGNFLGITASNFLFTDSTSFNFTILDVGTLVFTGAGINTSTGTQTFNYSGGSQGSINDNGSLGNSVIAINDTTFIFNANSSAGTANLSSVNNSLLEFRDLSTAGNAFLTIDNSAMNFLNNSTAGSSLLSTQNSTTLQFLAFSSAGNATISTDGSQTDFFNFTSAGTSNFFLTNGSSILFHDSAQAAAASFNIQGSNLFAQLNAGTDLFIGSLVTDFLSTISLSNGNALVLGGLGNSATIDGAIVNGGAGGGSLVKIGAGVLTLTNSNTYNLGTVINNGTLELSAFGNLLPTGPVNINASGAIFSISSLSTSSTSIGDLIGVSGGLVNLGNKELIVNSSTTTACASQITGAGGILTKQGPGTLILEGVNNYTGGTNVLDGNLQGNTTSLQGEIFNDATLTFDQALDGTFNGSFFGSGLINKNGAATLNLVANNSPFGGTTSVNQGRLSLNSTLGGNVVVQLASILSGNGTIGNNLIVNGIVSPGNSIGTIFVNGNYVQNAGSIYNVQINGSGQSSRLNITGSATLNPGSGVNFVSLDGLINPNVTYLILHADSGVSGTFTNVTSSNLMIVPILSYDLNNVFANFRRSFVGVAATKNQRAVARQLESIVDPDPAEDVLLTAITNLSVTEAQKVLDELSAQQYTNFLMTSELANRQFIRRVFNALRPSLVYDPCACTCDYLGKYYVWVEGGYGMDQYKKKGTIRGFKNKHYDITCGVQARPLDFFTLGTALSYEHAQMHYNLSASGRSHNFFGGIYSLYRPECFYILGELAVGYSDEKIRRRVNVGPVLSYRPHSKPKVIQSGLYLEAGKDYNFFCTHIQPFVGFEFGYHYLHQFHEHGAYPINLSVCAHTQDNADGRFGLHITPENCWNVLMSLDVAWEYRFTKFKNKIRERFLAFGNSFPIFGSYWTRNSIEAAFSFYVPFCECWEVFAEANGEWWQRLNTYNVMGGIGVKW